MYKVLLLNDDYTPMEFVVHVLESVFNKSRQEATDIMMQVHRRGVAQGQDQGRALAVLRTDGAEDVGLGVALVLRRHRPAAAPRPAPGDLVLLAYPSFILEPDFDHFALGGTGGDF
jgi:hypothetical protein